MLDEERHLLVVGGKHRGKEANTYGGSTIVGHLCPFPICGVPITSHVYWAGQPVKKLGHGIMFTSPSVLVPLTASPKSHKIVVSYF